MGGITKHGSAKRSIKILERDKEQTLKTLWGKEKLNDFFPRHDLASVDEMRKLHEEHREAKRTAREDSDMGMRERQPRRKRSSARKEQYGQESWTGLRSTRNKILYVLEFKRPTDQREEYEEGARVQPGRKAV